MDAGAILMVIGIFGNATGLFLFLAPICTFNRIIISKSIEHFSGVPYVMTLLNCLLSAWYGLPFVSRNNMLITIVNGIGAAFESIYVIIFLIFAPKKEKHKTLALLIFVLVVFSVVALVSIFALREKQRNFFCGYASTFFSILMYASPLSVTRMVIKTKSVEYMPFFLSLFAFLCGTSWFVYGLLEKDLFVAVPNGFGCVLGALQLILYAIYYDRERPAEKTSTCESVESGLGNGKLNHTNKIPQPRIHLTTNTPKCRDNLSL